MKVKLVLTLRLPWWFPYYVAGLQMASLLTGLEPDEQKLKRVVAYAVKKATIVERRPSTTRIAA